MKPILRPWILLLVAAILFFAALIWMRANPAPEDDPLAEARRDIADTFGMEVATAAGIDGGLIVETVAEGGVAQRAGIEVGDRIMTCGDRSVWHVLELAQLMDEQYQLQGAVTLLTVRGETYWFRVFGGQRPPEVTPTGPE